MYTLWNNNKSDKKKKKRKIDSGKVKLIIIKVHISVRNLLNFSPAITLRYPFIFISLHIYVYPNARTETVCTAK